MIFQGANLCALLKGSINTSRQPTRMGPEDRIISLLIQTNQSCNHPEVVNTTINDKCHQIRHALNTLNHASYKTFIPGHDVSFDEGGIASRSRFNPVRQFNKDKPQNFRMDFSILCNNTPEQYFIVHCDVYWGRNDAKTNIPQE